MCSLKVCGDARAGPHLTAMASTPPSPSASASPASRAAFPLGLQTSKPIAQFLLLSIAAEQASNSMRTPRGGRGWGSACSSCPQTHCTPVVPSDVVVQS